MDKKISGRAKQGRKIFSLLVPEVKQRAMKLLVPPFQGTQSSAQDTPGYIVLREPTATLGSDHYKISATPP